ncbi:MAG TPA: NYN domain-containing protein, partial [Hyphomicrobiaceae bacterium]|nr:NYN domain-containing protein [Hyphomicrobiaceae bacterium]
MKRTAGAASLSAVFVDYDNIYLSLKRKSDEAAKRFARDAHLWLREIESGRLITGTNDAFTEDRRRIVMNRCYGNPVPR